LVSPWALWGTDSIAQLSHSAHTLATIAGLGMGSGQRRRRRVSASRSSAMGSLSGVACTPTDSSPKKFLCFADKMRSSVEEMSMQIDKDVPLPKVGKRNHLYPYRDMEIGDSFFVEGAKIETILNANWRWGVRLIRKFIARQEEGGVRVWRLE